MSPADLLAVVDLGSNSFRLEVARLEENRLLSLLYRKETVRLAGGFAPDGTLTPEMQERALSALTRFRECLAGVAPENILAVGTHAMRRASQNAAFLCAAERALGVPIEIISGEREASFAFSGAVRTAMRAQSDMGDVDLSGALAGEIEVNANLGTVRIDSQLPRGAYALDLGTDMGNLTVDGERVGADSIGPSFQQEEGENSLHVRADMGDILVQFAAEE